MILEINRGKHGKGNYYECICDWCGNKFERMKSEFKDCERQFCNAKCYGNWKSKNCIAWNKGKIKEETKVYKGRFKTVEGYIRIYNPNFPEDDRKYILEHRFVIEQSLGKKLSKKDKIHHINGIKDDNRLENLMISDDSKHLKLHKNIYKECELLKIKVKNLEEEIIRLTKLLE